MCGCGCGYGTVWVCVRVGRVGWGGMGGLCVFAGVCVRACVGVGVGVGVSVGIGACGCVRAGGGGVG